MSFEPIEIEYEITLDDMMAVQRRLSEAAIRRKRVITLTTMAALIAGAFFVWHLSAGLLLVRLFITALSCLAVATGLWEIGDRYFITKIKRTCARKPHLLGPRRVSVAEDGFRVVTEHVDTTWKWSTVEKVEPTDKYAFVYVGAEQAIFLPRRAFSSSDAFKEFTETVGRLAEGPSQPVPRPVRAE